MSIRSARLLDARYQLHTILRHGGTSAVWAGVDTRLDRPVAVKVLEGAAQADPVMLQRLDREARTVARLAHPNVVAVYDVGTERDRPYLVMELVEGNDLGQSLARGPLDPQQAVGIAAQVCEALEAAHEAGVVHRDIKPENILITPAGTVKVCDFGIARLQQASQVRVTGAAITVGTSEYMAPEQATGSAVDARTDLYALGCVLYSMLTGAPPFSGDNPMQVLWQHVHQPVPPMASRVPGVPPDLDALVSELLAKDPGERPASAGQVRDRLVAMLEEPVTVSPAWPAALPGGPAQARATVVTKTRSMPSLEEREGSASAREGLRLGPLGISAVAIGAAAVAAIVVAGVLLLAAPSPPATTSADTTGAAGAAGAVSSSAPSSVGAPDGTVESVRAALRSQVLAGQVDEKSARDLEDRIDEIARNLSEGKTREARKNVAELGRKLAELQRRDKITNAAYGAIAPAVEVLAEQITSSDWESGDNANG